MIGQHKSIIVWLPRILVAFIILGVLAWDFWIFYLLCIPLVFVFAISWRKELFGAVIFLTLTFGFSYGLLYDLFKFKAGFRAVWAGFLLYLLTSILFFVSFKVRGKKEIVKNKFLKVLAILFTITLILPFFGLGWLSWSAMSMKTREFVIWKDYWYPQNIEVTAKNTPEDTYTKFREALFNDDIDGALELISFESREEYREAFGNKEKMKDWVGRLPEEIVKESERGSFAGYYYLNAVDNDDKIAHPIRFKKDLDGFWYIDSI